MTRQEIFDFIVGKLAIQKSRSYNEENGTCLYLSPNGNRCAVGHLIPILPVSDEVKEFMNQEIGDVYNLIEDTEKDFGEVLPDWMKREQKLLIKLQNIHDDEYERFWANPETFAKELEYVATVFSLNFDKEAWLETKLNS